jgi:hypothetical protein
MNPTDYTFDENNTMKITTKDTVYNFNGNDINLVNDTLTAEVSKKLSKNKSLKFNVAIPVVDIEGVEVERTDALATVLTTLGVLVGVLGLLILLGGDVNLGGEQSY